jgi:hypothetical protein
LPFTFPLSLPLFQGLTIFIRTGVYLASKMES